MERQGCGGPSWINFPAETAENGCPPSNLVEDDACNLQLELTKVEDEIYTLRQVLIAKERFATDIRRQLGMTPLSNIKQNLSKGWQEVQISTPYQSATATLEDISQSTIYKRTQQGLTHAGQVTSAALSTMGVAITRRLADMRALPLPSPPRSLSHSISVPAMRHSSTVKSFEEAVGNVKEKVTGSTNTGDTAGFERGTTRHNSEGGTF